MLTEARLCIILTSFFHTALPLDQLTNEDDRVEWLLRAILKTQHYDYRPDNLPYEDLLEIWADPDAAVEESIEQNYKGVSTNQAVPALKLVRS